MRIITKGHKYELSNFESKTSVGQTIQFIEKNPITENSCQLETVNDGTTNEEVLEMLINRMQYLDNKFDSDYNKICIWKLQEALEMLNARTADRKKRGVEGKAMD